jgi:hypothetical protein
MILLMARCTRYNIMSFVSDLRQVSGFLQVLRFLQTNKTDRHNIREILESGINTRTLTL